MNAAFHKSWGKVKDTPVFQLVMEQLLHYFTTYGFEQWGIYDRDTVFIPSERLSIPDLKDGISFTVIRGYTKQELKEKLLSLLNQGLALSEDTIKDVVDIALFVNLEEKEIGKIKNKESKVILFDYLDKLPEDPVEFLRFLVYKVTNKTLLIINEETISAIKGKQNIDVIKYFYKYKTQYSLERLAEIFLRFKPLFLAFKTNPQLRTIINKIRKLARTHHKPIGLDYLNTVTARITRGEQVDKDTLDAALSKVNVFRKIRLAYALNYRTRQVDSILYRIRNGKSYASEFTFGNKDAAKQVLETVMESIVGDVRRNVNGKVVFIPKSVVYSLPATEKQFTGDIPSGSYVSIPRDMVFGIHWDDVGQNRIDLDLSLISLNAGKVGWDSNYRTPDRGILFSGDVTVAPPPSGASELFYVARQADDTCILFVNYFNYDKDVKVPLKVRVAKETVRDFGRNYMVNPNDVICVASLKMEWKQKILGLATTTPKECRFYFCGADIGKSITSSGNKYTNQARNYLFNFYTNTISLNGVLEMAGAKVVNEKIGGCVDLSPESLQKDSIINLLGKH